MKMTKSVAAVIFGCALALLCAETPAQFPGGSSPRRGAHGGQSESREHGTKRQGDTGRENLPNLIEYRLDLFHEDLRLSAAQEPAWQSYARTVNALVSDIVRERARREANSEMGALQSAHHAVDVARDRLTALEEVASATEVLYSTLAPGQRTIADARVSTIFSAIDGGDAAGRPDASGKRRRQP